MDLMTVLGFIFGFGVVITVLKAGDVLGIIIHPVSALLVFGGTFSAILVSYPWRILKNVPLALTFIFFPAKRDTPKKVISTLVHLAEVARKRGIDGLSDEMPGIKDRFLNDGIQMLLDGLSPEIIRENLEKEIVFTRQRHQQISGVFRSMGTYSPIFGLLGTLLGVVEVLRNIADPKQLGQSMAVAVTATFYGIFGANFLFLPVAGKLNAYSEEEMLLKEVIIEGILSIQSGDVPSIVSRKLQSFLAYKLREKRGK
jgi:chemotaxis protein MotA